jgi:hypothetical protein
MQQPWSRENRPKGTSFVADYDGSRSLGTSEVPLDASETGTLRLWLSRYVPIDDDDARAA